MYNITGSYDSLKEDFIVETTLNNKLSDSQILKITNDLESVWGDGRVKI